MPSEGIINKILREKSSLKLFFLTKKQIYNRVIINKIAPFKTKKQRCILFLFRCFFALSKFDIELNKK